VDAHPELVGDGTRLRSFVRRDAASAFYTLEPCVLQALQVVFGRPGDECLVQFRLER
jgi:hypothetical protein